MPANATGFVLADSAAGTLVTATPDEGTNTPVKRMYYFTAGIALGALAMRRTRRAKEAARAALAAKLTPSAIAADIADAVAELGNAVGSFASDIRMGAANRRASYRPMIDGRSGDVVMVPPEEASRITARRALAGSVIDGTAAPTATGGRAADAR